MKFTKLLVLFLVLNLGALALGSWLMDSGPTANWYINLNKAPWTPPGWVFGAAWTTIMVCFSVYLAYLFKGFNTVSKQIVYGIQLVLNISWNYIFFNQHWVTLGLITIIALTVVLFYMFFKYQKQHIKTTRYLLLPYMIWLCIATSLNAYILIYN